MLTGRNNRAPRRRGSRRVRLDDLRRIVSIGPPQVSPGGERVVFERRHVDARSSRGLSEIWTVAASGRSPARPLTSGPADRLPRFAPDGERLAFVRAGEDGAPQVFVLPLAGGEARALTRLSGGQIADLMWSPTGEVLAIAYRPPPAGRGDPARRERATRGWVRSPAVVDTLYYRQDGDGVFGRRRFAVWIVDARTGAARPLYTRDRDASVEFAFAPDGGKLVVATNRHPRAELNPERAELIVIDVETGALEPLAEIPRGPKIAVTWSPDGRFLAWAGRAGGGDTAYGTENLDLWTFDLERRRCRNLTEAHDICLLSPIVSDVVRPVYCPKLAWTDGGRSILFEWARGGETQIARVGVTGGRVEILTRGRRVHRLGSVTADGRLAVAGVTDPVRPEEIARLDLPRRRGAARARLRRLTAFHRDWVRERTLVHPRRYVVRSSDGHRVEAWVLVPPGRRGKRPAVISVHGGPHARYGEVFCFEFQLLAAAGYAVVYSNPRGSKGYGRDHAAAIRTRWGEADWRDLDAVTRFAARHPAIDHARIGIMGGSYGGYLTNWAIAHSDAYRAAVTERGICNLVSFYGTSDMVEASDLVYARPVWEDASDAWRRSPLAHAGRIRTPTLILHAEGDMRCNIEQAEQLFVALSRRRVPCRFVRYPREVGHGMWRSGPYPLRIDRLERILAWWERYLARRHGASR